MNNVNEKLLKKVIEIAKEAGRAILEVYETDFEVSYKQDKSPLTIADKRSHEIIKARLKELTPRFPVLSEEGKDIPFDERKKWVYFWLVDPLDGTKEFIRRNGEFTVNIALIKKDKPILGVIYVPVKELLYFAEIGEGAFKLEEKRLTKIKVDQKIDDGGYRVVVSRSHMTTEVEQFLETIKVKERMSAGSSLKFCLIAEGRADIYPRFGPTMEWDTAAGQAIVEQAGGVVISRDSREPLKYNNKKLQNPWFICRYLALHDADK